MIHSKASSLFSLPSFSVWVTVKTQTMEFNICRIIPNTFDCEVLVVTEVVGI